MPLFQFPKDEVLTPYSVAPGFRGRAFGVSAAKAATLPLSGKARGVSFAADSKTPLAADNLQDQFVVFQMNPRAEGPTILESSQVDPLINGSPEEPDVLTNLEMLSFNLGANEQVDKATDATMRINFGKDENSRDKAFDTLFWSIAAGLKLYDQVKNQRAESKEFKGDFRKACGNRPIEIPGGLGKLSFEVVKHKEPAWWQKVFNFVGGDAGKSLISVLGFPAITYQAIGMLDELLNRLLDSKPEVLFKSLPMRLALSKQARTDFTGGNPRIKTGCLNPGFCILTRGRDFQAIASSNANYYPAYGKLAPGNVSETDLVGGRYDDPLKNVTYAVFRLGMKKTKLDPTFNFG